MSEDNMMNILNEFPQATRLQILHYLTADNFKAAKQLYDQYLQQKRHEKQQCGGDEK